MVRVEQKNAAEEWNDTGRMADAGREALPDMSSNGFVIDKDILKALKSDSVVWENFNKFPLLIDTR